MADAPTAATRPFSFSDPLPGPGTTVIEASAGTGKTATLAGLVTRFLAEGLDPDHLLAVTFTRMATGELRERIRQRVSTAEATLGQALAAGCPGAGTAGDVPVAQGVAGRGDELVAQLLSGPAGEVAVRHQRLADALAGFDAVTITTTHGFCQLVLSGLGSAGDVDVGATLLEDPTDLVDEVVSDLYLRHARLHGRPGFGLSAARAAARAAVANPDAEVVPAPTDGALLSRLASRARVEVLRRLQEENLLTYDQLLERLSRTLEHHERGPAACDRLRCRYRVVLVDEFQDTDPVQWQVFQRAFADSTTMVLIGDPKQAIYAFRGGDIVTYLAAADAARTTQTLGVNWRSDQPLLDGLQALLEGATLGDPRIAVHPVTANYRESRLSGAGAPFRLRVVRRQELGKGPRSKPPVAVWREHVITDAAHDIKRLIQSGATFEGRALAPGDIAVLAARRSELEATQEALAVVGVPSVINAGGSVFHTPAAAEWVTLLEALEQPHRADRVRAAALTSFFGYSAAALDAGGDQLTDSLAERVRTLTDVFTTRGVAAVLEVTVVAGLTARVLGRVGGERTLTDIRHIGEALHRVSVEDRLGIVGVLGWLREQVADDKVEVASERTRRLDSDAAAVQLVTIHGSKGLQYPVVYLPTLWNRYVGNDPEIPLFHDDEGRRCRDVGGRSPFHRHSVARHWREDAGESLRLLYVALTRAQSQVVAWYAAAERNTPASPLHRMLFGRRPQGVAVPDEQALVAEDRLLEILGHWQAAGGPAVELAALTPPDPTPLERSTEPLAVRTFTRIVDTAWRRTSYSSLSAAGAAHSDAGTWSEPLSEPEDPPELGDAFLLTEAAPPPDVETAAVPSPMADLPVGATFGSLVHAVLEHADPAASDFRAELLAHISEQLVWWPVDLDAEALADALAAVCSSPLGPLADDLTLLDLRLPDRLRELDFELPLAGGDDAAYPTVPVRLGDLAPLLRRHLPLGDPVLSYADTLDGDPDLADQELRGYLTGSIDVVLRVAGRFLTVDYKTNWLGDLDAPLTAHDYRPAVLDDAMGHSDYPLQALLYTVVLHRFLRWRLADYDPATHLGGVLYLYLRGMCGPDTPRIDGAPCGVFAWRPPLALVEAMSALLDGADERTGARA